MYLTVCQYCMHVITTLCESGLYYEIHKPPSFFFACYKNNFKPFYHFVNYKRPMVQHKWCRTMSEQFKISLSVTMIQVLNVRR